jgi:hypothetical protein
MTTLNGVFLSIRKGIWGGLVLVTGFILMAAVGAQAQWPVYLSLKATRLMVTQGQLITFEAVPSPTSDAELIYEWFLRDEDANELPGVLAGEGPKVTLDTSHVKPGRYSVDVHAYADLENPPLEAYTRIVVRAEE